MSDSMLSCPVCLVEFDEEKVVPRILNCSHTVCEGCLQELVRDKFVVCPECRKKHVAGSGATSFPQNRYLLKILETSSKFTQCDEHKRDQVLYCRDCQKKICHVCLLSSHRNHDVLDLVQEQEGKIDTLVDHLQKSRERWLFKAEEVKKQYETEVKKLTEMKKEQDKVFDDLISRTSIQLANFSEKTRQKVDSIDESISELEAAKKLRSPRKMIESCQRIKCSMTLHADIKYDRFTFRRVKARQSWDVLSNVEEICIRSPKLCDKPVESRLVTKFPLNGEVRRVLSLSCDTLAVWIRRMTSSSIDNLEWLQQYDIKGTFLQRKYFRFHVRDMVEVTLDDKRCLAVFIGSKIEFLDVNNLENVILTHQFGQKPTLACRYSEDTVLFLDSSYWGCEGTANMLECRRLRPGATGEALCPTSKREVVDMVCVGTSDSEMLIYITYSDTHGQIFARNIQSQKVVWKVMDRVFGMEERMRVRGVTADEEDHIYIRDGEEAVHKLTAVDGKYVSTVLKKGENGIGAIHRMTWSKQDSSLVVVHQPDELLHLSAVKFR